jgi:uncharacterized protein YdeI (YjbR/CyaY-like superfamily)
VSAPKPTDVRFFRDAAALRDWFDANHDSADQLWIGFYKRGVEEPSVTYKEAVDEALCFGWIDSVTYRLDDRSWAQRFTPRRKRSIWSAVNTKRMGELLEAGLVRPAGIAAFEARDPERTAIYSYERAAAALDDESMARFQAQPGALDFFEAQSPSYKRAALYWVLSAKRPETRERRLTTLIEDSAAGRRLKQLA